MQSLLSEHNQKVEGGNRSSKTLPEAENLSTSCLPTTQKAVKIYGGHIRFHFDLSARGPPEPSQLPQVPRSVQEVLDSSLEQSEFRSLPIFILGSETRPFKDLLHQKLKDTAHFLST